MALTDDLSNENIVAKTKIDKRAIEDDEPSSSGDETDTVYPGFRIWFYCACALLFGVLFIALYDIFRTVMRERKMNIEDRN